MSRASGWRLCQTPTPGDKILLGPCDAVIRSYAHLVVQAAGPACTCSRQLTRESRRWIVIVHHALLAYRQSLIDTAPFSDGVRGLRQYIDPPSEIQSMKPRVSCLPFARGMRSMLGD